MSTSHYDQLCTVWQNTLESDSRRPRQSRALHNEELFVVEGSQKIIALKNRDSTSKWTESEKWRKMRLKTASNSHDGI